MSFVSVSDLSYAHPGGESLFFDVSFHIAAGDHVALIGDNGVGKSTLFRIAGDRLVPDEGAVSLGGRVLYMPQEVGFDNAEATVREMLLDLAEPQLRTVGHAMVKAERQLAEGDESAGVELGNLITQWSELGGFHLESQWDASIQRIVRSDLDDVGGRLTAELSGGERKQLVLDFLFGSDADILLMDEPDNYLDVPAKKWLEDRIKNSRKTILLISHDRTLLANAARKVITLEASGAWVHGDSYRTYAEARRHRQELLGDDLKRWNDEERRLFRHFKIMKQRAAQNDKNAPKADAAETRWKRFIAGGPPPAPVADQQISVRLVGGESARRAVVIRAVGIPGLFPPFSDEVRFGERVGVIGPNGSGKTHLMRLIAGEDVPHSGTTTLGNRCSAGLFTQVNSRPDFVRQLVGDIVMERLGAWEISMAALARYGLQGAAKRPFETLSSGQKARLEILCLELEGHNLLLLDEPTDNLDVDSSEALEGALNRFEGVIISVSHDRTFLRQMDRFLLMLQDGRIYGISDFDTAMEALLAPDRVADIRSAKLLTEPLAVS
jgi:ATPase subunit of ABC transporter with duplicated ATPase domains